MTDYRKRLEAVEMVARLHDPDLSLLLAVYDAPTEGARRDRFATDLSKLLSEGERMREALRQIADGSAPSIPHGHYLAHRHAVNVARVALRDPDPTRGKP